MQHREIKVCAGIGDSIWLFQKLINSGEKFNFKLPDGKPQRGKQIFDLLPSVVASSEYVSGLSYKILELYNIQKSVPLWSKIKDRSFYLSCNSHLEKGNRLEDFLPDLPITFKIDWNTSTEDSDTAKQLLPAPDTYIGFYGSSYSAQRSWGFWNERGWFQLIKMFHERDPHLVPVIIGADFDGDLGGRLIQLLQDADIPHVNTIGQPLSVVIEILKRLAYFIGFPSGLSILNETLGKDTFMFYPSHLKLMMNTWAEPSRIESGAYKAAQFCTPEVAFSWINNEFKLFHKL